MTDGKSARQHQQDLVTQKLNRRNKIEINESSSVHVN